MAKVAKRGGNPEKDRERVEAGLKKRRSIKSPVLSDSNPQPPNNKGPQTAKTSRVPDNDGVSGTESVGTRKVLARQPGSVLVRSMAKPESQMTTFEKMEATRMGISKNQLEELKKRAGLDYDQLSHILQVARATLIAKKGSEKFPSLLSEKIMSLADIYSYGYDVFGNEQEFNKWIFQPLGALGGKSPYEILDNGYGREELKHIIGRIEYGVYS